MSDAPVISVSDEVHGCPTTVSYGQTVVHVPLDRYLEVITALKADGYNMCIDVTAVDYLSAEDARPLPVGVTPQRFEVVVNLLSIGVWNDHHGVMTRDESPKRRIRVRTQVQAEKPEVPTLFDLFAGTEAMEREVFDLMGIRFGNHPDLTRILMPEDWEGHPLRKDYDQQRIPVQFKYTANQYDTERTTGKLS